MIPSLGATGAGNIDAFAKVETDSANAAVKTNVLNTLRPPELMCPWIEMQVNKIIGRRIY